MPIGRDPDDGAPEPEGAGPHPILTESHMSGMVNPGGILRVTEFTGSPSWARDSAYDGPPRMTKTGG